MKLQYFGHLMWSWLIGKDPDAGKDWGQEEKGAAEDDMIAWQHQLNGHEFEETERWRTGKPGVLQSKGLQRVGHNWVTEQQQQPELSVSLISWKDHCEFKSLEQILEDLGNVRERMILRAQEQQIWSGEKR